MDGVDENEMHRLHVVSGPGWVDRSSGSIMLPRLTWRCERVVVMGQGDLVVLVYEWEAFEARLAVEVLGVEAFGTVRHRRRRHPPKSHTRTAGLSQAVPRRGTHHGGGPALLHSWIAHAKRKNCRVTAWTVLLNFDERERTSH